MLGLSYPLTKEALHYFNIVVEDCLTHQQMEMYLKHCISNHAYPKEKALDIWDKFVVIENLTDLPQQFITDENLKSYRKIIEDSDDIDQYLWAFHLVGLISPFWSKKQLR